MSSLEKQKTLAEKQEFFCMLFMGVALEIVLG